MIWSVEAHEEGMRLDVYIADHAELTRSRAGNLIRGGYIFVDGEVQTKPGFMLKRGGEVRFEEPATADSGVQAQPIDLSIIYQDEDLAVVYKPAGMVVHPAAGNHDGTLVNALLYHLDGLSGIGGVSRPGIVHRIDKDTSGLLLVAKNDRSHVMLSEQIQAHSVTRAYLAIVIGNFSEEEGVIEGNIGRHKVDRKKMAITPEGKRAVTNWRVLERLRGACLIEARLTTGRTHQIRVHMASIGHPVLGDPVYGPKKSPFPVEGGQLLHAAKIGFLHPTTGEYMEFTEQPEMRFRHWLEKLRIH